jgi:cyanophycin synthetase
MRIKLDNLVDVQTNSITGFNEKILYLFPGLLEHKCSLGYKGGFVKRLEEGTYLAHVIEHLCLELEYMLGYDMKYGKARNVEEDIYDVIFACPNPSIGKVCANFIVDLVYDLINPQDFDFKTSLENLKKTCSKLQFGPSTAAIVKEAKTRGIPVNEIDDSGIIRLGYGKYQKYLSSTIVENTSCIAVDMACDKSLTKFLLSEEGIPIPSGNSCLTEDDAVKLGNQLGYPLVMKPKHGNHGKYVFIGIEDEQSLREVFRKIISFDKQVIIEKLISGKDYRFLIVDGKLVAAAERIKAHVIGDGINTVEKLIEITNEDELRGENHEKPLTKIIIDDDTLRLLKQQEVQLSSVPLKNQKIWLKGTANLSTGGIAIDCTDSVHPQNIEFAVKAANCLGLHIAGVDIVVPDISKPMNDGFGAIVEVNAAPGLRMHISPSEGKSRDVASPILDMLYPKGHCHSVPIISITGTNGKTTTTRMISHILHNYGLLVGQTTTSGIFIGNQCIEHGDTTGPKSAKKVLNNRKIDVAVLETARGGIIREGLAYEKADVAVFTNLSEDHIGLDGVNTASELFHIKSLVIEAVKDTGKCILNADDPWVKKAIKVAKGEVILFSLFSENKIIMEHVKNGGCAIYTQGDTILIKYKHLAKEVMKIRDIPATLNETLKNNIYNSLAAIGACYAIRIPIGAIVSGLKTFQSDPICNPGRFNIFEMSGYKIILDYGHNYHGYKSTIESLKAMKQNRIIGIIGVPGDRRQEDITNIGFISGKSFDKIFVKEDKYKRGREPLEVANMLYSGALEGGINANQIEIIPDEEEALISAIEDAQEGDCILMFYEEFDNAVKIINEMKLFEKQALKV